MSKNEVGRAEGESVARVVFVGPVQLTMLSDGLLLRGEVGTGTASEVVLAFGSSVSFRVSGVAEPFPEDVVSLAAYNVLDVWRLMAITKKLGLDLGVMVRSTNGCAARWELFGVVPGKWRPDVKPFTMPYSYHELFPPTSSGSGSGSAATAEVPGECAAGPPPAVEVTVSGTGPAAAPPPPRPSRSGTLIAPLQWRWKPYGVGGVIEAKTEGWRYVVKEMRAGDWKYHQTAPASELVLRTVKGFTSRSAAMKAAESHHIYLMRKMLLAPDGVHPTEGDDTEMEAVAGE